MTTYAQISERTAGLWTEFGLNFATRLFGAEALADLPRFQKGKNKGKIKAVLRWRKVERGGWVSRGASYYDDTPNGHVENRVGKIIEAELRESAWPEPYGALIKSLPAS